MADWIRKADSLGKVVTVAPSVWRRLGKYWQTRVFPAKLERPRPFHDVKRFFFSQINGWSQITDVQKSIFQIWGYKISVNRLKWWIVRRKIGKEPTTMTRIPHRHGGWQNCERCVLAEFNQEKKSCECCNQPANFGILDRRSSRGKPKSYEARNRRNY